MTFWPPRLWLKWPVQRQSAPKPKRFFPTRIRSGGTPRTENNDDEHLTGFLHTCIEVDDINAIAEQVKKNGGTMFVEPMKGCDNNYQAWVIDPDGNRIEFMQLEPDSPQSTYRF